MVDKKKEDKKKAKKKEFNPTKSELKRVLRRAVTMLKPEERGEIVRRALRVSKRHYAEDRMGDPSAWKFYGGIEWLSYGLKEILNVRAGRPIDDYRAGMLTLDNLRELAEYFGLEMSNTGKIKRSALWSQIVAKVKEDEDSRINRLKKLWQWLEERIDVTDVDYLMVHAPGYWKDRGCYLNPDWRLRHLTNIFELSFIIREVADAKMKSENRTPVVSGLSKIQLWVITQKIMNLKLPHNATKEVMWQKILEKIEQDKKKQVR